jgi:hypothetical protein
MDKITERYMKQKGIENRYNKGDEIDAIIEHRRKCRELYVNEAGLPRIDKYGVLLQRELEKAMKKLIKEFSK